ncbi:protease [Kutzneria sp. 744]|nr:protease [Kutzneria sp. 744]
MRPYPAGVATTSWIRPGDPDGGLRLFRVRNVPVLLAPSWWIGSIVVTALYTPMVGQLMPGIGTAAALVLAASFALLLGASVLAHELGHCVVALRYGLPVRRLRLFLLGGISEVGRSPAKPAQEGMVAAAGPAVSIVLALVFGATLFVVPQGGPIWLLLLETTLAQRGGGGVQPAAGPAAGRRAHAASGGLGPDRQARHGHPHGGGRRRHRGRPAGAVGPAAHRAGLQRPMAVAGRLRGDGLVRGRRGTQ